MFYLGLGICSTIIALIASLLYWKMNIQKTKIESDSDWESSDETEPKEIAASEEILDTDAVNPDGHGAQQPFNLKLSEVRDVGDALDYYERISLMFLLSDNPQDCLKINEDFREWAREEMMINSSWDDKLWEALAIIKNFQVPKKYGITKKFLEEKYFPYQYFTTTHVSKFKKVLFFICENFTQANEKLFLDELRKDFEKKNLTFVEKYPQMEMYFSYLLKIGYLSKENVQNCLKIAKALDMEYEYDLFKYIEEQYLEKRNKNKKTKPIVHLPYSKSTSVISTDDQNNDSSEEKGMKKQKVLTQISNCTSNISSDDEIHDEKRYLSVATSDSTQDNVPLVKDMDERYNMDGLKLCLIIDQENFYKEIESKFKKLLAPNVDREPLHPRQGTKQDSKRLKSLFESRNFQVKTEKNLNHLKMIEALENFVKNIDRKTVSCFLVVILSHGSKDVVYGANSCYVEISHIISIMDNKKFRKIPKGLILQACQGQSLLEHVDENLAIDGASAVESSDLKSPNFFLFSSTVPGYASVRDKSSGTWFIQSLCEQLEKYADREHFIEICTRITGDVGNYKWRQLNSSYQMIPYLRATLCKKLYM